MLDARPAPFLIGQYSGDITMPNFVRDVEEIRQRAIQKIEDGAVTSTYGLDVKKSIEILNEALATEIVCVLRYMHHYFMATGVHGRAAADEFKEHADEEREHADKLGERIQQLGGKPDFNPKSLLERSVSQYVEGENLADMIREDLIAERVVIDVYREMIKFFGDKDPTTRILIEELLEAEEEHASDLSDLLYVVNPRTGETEVQDPGTEIGGSRHERQEERLGGRGNGAERRGNGRQQSREAAKAFQQERNQAQSSADNDAEEAREALGNIGERQGREGGRPQATKVQSRGENAPSEAPLFQQGDRGGRRDRSEARPSRSTGQERPGAGRRDVQPAHAPGTTGRVMGRRGRNDVAPADDDVALGGQSGASRSAKVVNKNRKNRAA
jgi:bacterioferritin